MYNSLPVYSSLWPVYLQQWGWVQLLAIDLLCDVSVVFVRFCHVFPVSQCFSPTHFLRCITCAELEVRVHAMTQFSVYKFVDFDCYTCVGLYETAFVYLKAPLWYIYDHSWHWYSLPAAFVFQLTSVLEVHLTELYAFVRLCRCKSSFVWLDIINPLSEVLRRSDFKHDDSFRLMNYWHHGFSYFRLVVMGDMIHISS